MADEGPRNVHTGNDRIGIGMIVSAVILLLLVVFVVQNRERVDVEFLFISVTMPVWLVAVVFTALGVALGWIWRWVSRRRARA